MGLQEEETLGYSGFLQAKCPSCDQKNSIEALNRDKFIGSATKLFIYRYLPQHWNTAITYLSLIENNWHSKSLTTPSRPRTGDDLT